MVDLSDSSGSVLVKSENGGHDRVWSDEQDCVPLKQRLKLLLASKRLSGCSDADSEKGSENSSLPRIDVLAKKEDRHCDSQGSSPACCAQEGRNERLSPKQTNAGVLRKNSFQGTVVNEYVSSNGNSDTASVEKVDVSSNTLLPCLMPSNYPIKVEVDYVDNSLMNSLGDGVRGSLCNDVQAVKLRTKIADEFMHDLDHVVLKERQKLLLSRKCLELKKPVPEGNCSWFSNPVTGDKIQHTLHIEKKENHSGDAESSFSGNPSHVDPERNASDFCETLESGSPNDIIRGSSCTILKRSPLMGSCQVIGSAKAETSVEIQGSDEISSSKKVSNVNLSCGRQEFVPGISDTMLSSTVPLTYKNIKAEPLDYGEVHSLKQDAICNFPTNGINPVKSELEIPEESYGDEIDHLLLRDRIQLLTSRVDTHLDNSRKFECSKRMIPSVLPCTSTASESYIPIRISRPRKRRKTATDSVETALEEDAPGLLQVLIDKGVSVDEMKLYGEIETDEALDDSFSEDNFSELEAVVSKLFSQRQSLLKFAPLRCTKGEKASYCLACLISLVEQARYLQFRKWPVEWGWCRDLQSFVFVFERHNRIVLERPEYGYATYFFELVDSLPVDWQIKRLVTAMKLTSCSRVTLIENKSLLVGEDLTEGEARVLMEYGWVPNSGLGTMLNYCDRVVHDRKNERDSSEWRSKIGKLLMDGYNGGTIVSTEIPKKVMEYSGGQGARIKLEL